MTLPLKVAFSAPLLLDVDVGAQQISVTDREGHVDVIANVEALTFADGVVRLGDTYVIGAGAVAGTGASELFAGSSGVDTVFAESGNDFVSAGAGDDSVSGAEGNDFVDGGDGNDLIQGDGANDTLFSRDGVDVVEGGRPRSGDGRRRERQSQRPKWG